MTTQTTIKPVRRWTMAITNYGSGPEIAPTVRENGKYVLSSDYDLLMQQYQQLTEALSSANPYRMTTIDEVQS
jgi:hypothetical protein